MFLYLGLLCVWSLSFPNIVMFAENASVVHPLWLCFGLSALHRNPPTRGPKATNQMSVLSLWSHCSPPHLDGSNFKAQGAFLPLPPLSCSIKFQNVHPCMAKPVNCQSSGIVAMKVHAPWGLTDGTGKGRLGEDSFRYK